MGDINRALIDIVVIRRQMARATEFWGYGPATLAATGLFAFCAAGVQSLRVPAPPSHTAAYLILWVGTAFLSATLTGAQMVTRTRRLHSGLSQEMLRMACEQFLPSGAAGFLLTLVLVRYVPSAVWMLPGLWQIVFSIGIFSSCRFLPRAMLTAGVWYLFTGLFAIALGGTRALSPWVMGVPFGVGQLIVAEVLFFAKHEVPDEA